MIVIVIVIVIIFIITISMMPIWRNAYYFEIAFLKLPGYIRLAATLFLQGITLQRSGDFTSSGAARYSDQVDASNGFVR